MQKKGISQNTPSFLIKIVKNFRIERKYLNILKTIYERTTANIILNGEKLKAFPPLRSGTPQRCPLSPMLFSIVLEVLVSAFREQNNVKCIQIDKELKLSFFTGDIILYMENLKDSTKNLLELIY